MHIKLNVIVAAAVSVLAGNAMAQDMVVKIGHVAPVSGAQAHYGKDNENGARMAIEDHVLRHRVAGQDGYRGCDDHVEFNLHAISSKKGC